jgi:hypothetical protein
MNPLKKAKRKAKRSIANATGVPTTKSGRSRKVERIEGQAVLWIVVIVAVIWLVAK